MNRRGFLKGILAAGVAPYVITTPGLLMPVRGILVPAKEIILSTDIEAAVAYNEDAWKSLLMFGWALSRDGKVLSINEAAKYIKSGALCRTPDVRMWDFKTNAPYA